MKRIPERDRERERERERKRRSFRKPRTRLRVVIINAFAIGNRTAAAPSVYGQSYKELLYSSGGA
jgi:hypothetical protein